MYFLRRLLFSFILIISTLNLIPYKLNKKNNSYNKLDINLVEAYRSNYIGNLIINKIDLNEGYYDINNPLNNVDYGLEVLKPSIMPDKSNSIVFIASHSGDSKISYFKNLYELRNDDEIILTYKDKDYLYKVIKKEVIAKNGLLNIKSFPTNSLILITCIKGTNNQLVITCK